MLHTKPKIYIDDITITTDVHDNTGLINYNIEIVGSEESDIPVCKVNLLNADGQSVINSPSYGFQGTLQVTSPKLWWPQSMSENPGYLYTFEVNNNSKRHH